MRYDGRCANCVEPPTNGRSPLFFVYIPALKRFSSNIPTRKRHWRPADTLPIYLMFIWAVVAVAMVAVAYLGLGGRALFGTRERPERILGRRVQLMDLESGPKGLDPEQPALPPAVVESYQPVGEYLIRFDVPVVWLGRRETHATVAARSVGYPVSRAAGIWRRRVWVAGEFGSGEAFLGELRRISRVP